MVNVKCIFFSGLFRREWYIYKEACHVNMLLINFGIGIAIVVKGNCEIQTTS